MKRRSLLIPLAILLIGEVSCLSAAPSGAKGNVDQAAALPPNPAPPVPTEARRLALESAGAFTNDGFRIRDAEWPFTLAKAASAFLRVTLFGGNHYWFVVATSDSGATLRVTLYDSRGHPLKSEQWQDGGAHEGSRAAAGIAPDKSGSYFVGVELLDSPSDLPLDCSLVSAYK